MSADAPQPARSSTRKEPYGRDLWHGESLPLDGETILTFLNN
jgi:hypothetical protein